MRHAVRLAERAHIVPEFHVSGISAIEVAGRMLCFTLYSKRRRFLMPDKSIVCAPTVRLLVSPADARRNTLQASVALAEFEAQAEITMVH